MDTYKATEDSTESVSVSSNNSSNKVVSIENNNDKSDIKKELDAGSIKSTSFENNKSNLENNLAVEDTDIDETDGASSKNGSGFSESSTKNISVNSNDNIDKVSEDSHETNDGIDKENSQTGQIDGSIGSSNEISGLENCNSDTNSEKEHNIEDTENIFSSDSSMKNISSFNPKKNSETDSTESSKICTETSLTIDNINNSLTKDDDYVELSQKTENDGDSFGLLEKKKNEYLLFKNSLDEDDLHLAELVETKISDINEEKINSIKAQFQDEIELRDFSTRIVMDKMNYAYQNVLKEEYDKKITIFSTESNQNQMKTTRKMHHEYESKISEFKKKIKLLETELATEKNDSTNTIKNLNADWSARYQKLDEDKNDKITKQLKKSIELIDENELLENQLEQLYVLIEEKTSQVNSLEERQFKHQNEIKKLQIELNSFQKLGYKCKIHNSQDKAVECNFSDESRINDSLDNVSVDGNEVSEILKNNIVEESTADDQVSTKFPCCKYKGMYTELSKRIENQNETLLCPNEKNQEKNEKKEQENDNQSNDFDTRKLNKAKKESKRTEIKLAQYLQTENLKKKLNQVLNSDLDYLKKKLVAAKSLQENSNDSSRLNNEITTKRNLINLVNQLNETGNNCHVKTQEKDQVSFTIENEHLSTLINTVMLFLNDNSFEENTRNESIETSDEVHELDHEENVQNKDNIELNRRMVKSLSNQNLASVLSKTLFMNTSIEEHINTRLAQIIQASQNYLDPSQTELISSRNSCSASSSNSLHSNSTGKKDSLSISDSNSSAAQSQQFNSPGHSSRGHSPTSGKDNISRNSLIEDSNEELACNLEQFNISRQALNHITKGEGVPEALTESNTKIKLTVDKVLDMFEDTSKQLVESHSLQVQLAMKLEDNQKAQSELQSKYDNIEVGQNEINSELLNRINNLEGLTNAYELDIESKNQSINQLEQILIETKQELNSSVQKLDENSYEIENLRTIKKGLEDQRSLFLSEQDDNTMKELIESNSVLLDEKHQLQYKLNKETEISKMQIKELEQNFEQINDDSKLIKDKYEEQIYDLKRQIESMGSQIKSEKEFINIQLAEREQERDEYESKIKYLNEMMDRKSTQTVENDDSALKGYIQDIELKNKELEFVLQERTDRLNQLSIVNEQLERTVQEKEQLIVSLPLDIKKNEETIAQYKEEISHLLDVTKKQNESLNGLKEKLSENEKLSQNHQNNMESTNEKISEITEEREHIQKELYSYMSRLSDLQIHTESLEDEHKKDLSDYEDKINKMKFTIEEKEEQLEQLTKDYNELNEDIEKKIEVETHDLRLEYEQNKTLNQQLKEKLATSEAEISELKENLESQEEKFDTEKKTSEQLSHNLIQNKNEEIDDLLNSVNKLKLCDEHNTASIYQLKEKITVLENDQAAAEKKVEELKEIIDENELIIQQNGKEIDSLGEEQIALKNEITEYLEKIEAKNDEIEFLKSNQAGDTAESNSANDESKKKSDENIEIALQENDELKRKLQEKFEQLEELHSSCTPVRDYLEMKEKCSVYEESYINENKLLLQLNETFEQFKKNTSDQIENYKQQIEKLTQESHEKSVSLDNEDKEDIMTKKLNDELLMLKSEHEKIVKELKSQYEQQLKAANSSQDDSSSPDTSISIDIGQKLKEQIHLTKELDSHLHQQLDKQLKDQTLNNSLKEIPENIKDIIQEIEKGNVEEISIGELLEYKSFTCNNGSGYTNNMNDNDYKLKLLTIENEKNKLESEIYDLKNLLSNIKNIDLNEPEFTTDWREEVIKQVMEVFQKENELSMSELRNYVVGNLNDQSVDQISYLATKISNQHQIHTDTYEKLKSIDADSKNFEIDAQKNEIIKLTEELSSLKEKEIQLKQELKQIEYSMDAESVKNDDIKKSLVIEKDKNLEIMDKLNLEKKKVNDLQEQIFEKNDELENMKEILNTEDQKHLNTLKESEKYQNEVNNLQNKLNNLKEQGSHNVTLQEFLKQEKLKNEKLQHLINDMRNKENKLRNLNSNTNMINFERMRQSLEHIALRLTIENESFDYNQNFNQTIAYNLSEIIQELQELGEKVSNIDSHRNSMFPLSDSNSKSVSSNGSFLSDGNSNNILENKLMDQNKDLLNTIKRLNYQKLEHRNVIHKLEEDVKILKHKNKHELSALSEHDKEKFKKLYLKYLRAESFRKSLVYQKRFLIIMLSGYEETEREILATLKYESNFFNNHSNHSSSHSSSGSTDHSPHNSPSLIKTRNYLYQKNGTVTTRGTREIQSINNTSIYSSRFKIFKAKSRFRTAVICLISISRIKFLVKKHSGILGKVENHYRH